MGLPGGKDGEGLKMCLEILLRNRFTWKHISRRKSASIFLAGPRRQERQQVALLSYINSSNVIVDTKCCAKCEDSREERDTSQ